MHKTVLDCLQGQGKNKPPQVGLKRIGTKMKFHTCQRKRCLPLKFMFICSLSDLCCQHTAPQEKGFYQLWSLLYLPLSHTVAGRSKCSKVCRMSEGQCLLWAVLPYFLHWAVSASVSRLTLSWWGLRWKTFSHSSLLPLSFCSVLYIWWTWMGLRGVVQSRTPCSTWGSDRWLSRHLLSCTMGLIWEVREMTFSLRMWDQELLLSARGCSPPWRKSWVEHPHFRGDHVGGGLSFTTLSPLPRSVPRIQWVSRLGRMLTCGCTIAFLWLTCSPWFHGLLI